MVEFHAKPVPEYVYAPGVVGVPKRKNRKHTVARSPKITRPAPRPEVPLFLPLAATPR